MIDQFQKYLTKYQKRNGDKLLPRTIENYLYYMERYTDELSKLKGDALVQKCNEYLKARPSMPFYSAIRKWFEFIGEKELASKLEKPPKRANSQSSLRYLQSKILSRGELKRLYDESDDFTRMIFSILYDTGCRRSEVLSIRHKDIEVLKQPKDNIYVKIQIIGKGYKSRTVYLTKESLDLIRKVYPKKRPESMLIEFRKPDGNLYKFQEDALYRHVKKWCRKILGRDISPHNLRATLASHLSDTGADVLGISRLLGHADIGTTQIYTRSSVYPAKQAFQHIKDGLE